MKTCIRVAAMFLMITGPAMAQDAPKAQMAKTLYARMGGYDILASITDDFLSQLGSDPAFQRFGGGRSIGSLQRSRQLIVDQLCGLTGGPCVYIGREMKPAHQGLGITQAEWNSGIVKLKNSLAKLKVADPEQKEFMALIDKTEKDIVEPPKKDGY